MESLGPEPATAGLCSAGSPGPGVASLEPGLGPTVAAASADAQ